MKQIHEASAKHGKRKACKEGMQGRHARKACKEGMQGRHDWFWVYVVVNFFLSQVIFIFPLFLGMVIYANELETKEKQKLPEIKN